MNLPSGNQRLQALDVFRGLTVFLMIVVNTQGSGAVPYQQLMHADWNGLTLTDVVFPSFLFAAGNALVFTIRKGMGDRRALLWRIVKRSVLIFVVGVALGWYATMHFTPGGVAFVDWGHLRILAVLQRIAICYLVAAVMAIYIPPLGLWICCVVFLIGYWLALYLGGAAGQPYAETTNLVRAIDWHVLGEAHMYRERGIVFDPEGLLSTVPATVNVIAGYLTGKFLLEKGRDWGTAGILSAVGFFLCGCGLLWSVEMPLNKKLWTSTFVFVTTGIDLLVMAMLFYFLELRRWRFGVHFFTVLGKNPLVIYIFSNLLLVFLIWPVGDGTIAIDWINTRFFQWVAPGPLGCLLFALCFALFCWVVAWWLDRRKLYLRL
jgi:predicted acyltransferase